MPHKYRAGAIGRTGGGNFGHQLDVAYQGLPDVEFVALADPDQAGREAAAKRTGATGLYADYHEMLQKEHLDIVSVSPRWPNERREMVIACAEAGVKGIYCEKPMAATLADADAMLAACDRHGVRMAVAHRRACAYEQHAKQLVEQGVIGDIQVMRAHGKADHRAGSLDFMILGTHMLDSMRYFAGSDVAWVHGHITQDGREITPQDVHQGDEAVGLLAGNGVAAYFAFKNGITAHYESYRGSRPGERSPSRWFGFEVYGTKGAISLRNSPIGEMYLYPYGLWLPDEADGRWERIVLQDWEKDATGRQRTDQELTHMSNQMIVRELIQAIEADRDVVASSSGRDARAVLEMIMAAHESQIRGARAYLPLENRGNPYATWKGERNGR